MLESTERRRTTLGQVAKHVAEQVDPSSDPGLLYVGLEHIDSGTPRLSRWGRAIEVRSAKNRFRRNDLLYGKLRPYLDKAVVADQEGICSTDILVIRSTGSIDPDFLSYLAHSEEFLAYAVRTTSGVNHPRTSWSALQDFEFSLPPLEEQRAIANVLSSVSDSKYQSAQFLESLSRLRESLAAELFAAQKTVKFATVVKEIRHGMYKPRQDAGQTRILKMGVHFKSIEIAEQEMERINVGHDEITRYGLRVDDLVFARTSMMKAGAGKCSIVLPHKGPIVFDGNLLAVTLGPGFQPRFLLHYFNSPQAKQQFVALTGGTQLRSISSSNLLRVAVPSLPVERQQQVAAIMDEVEGRIATEVRWLEALSKLSTELRRDLMAGKLLPVSEEGLADA
jgi:type I restriction enzyme, S subunit